MSNDKISNQTLHVNNKMKKHRLFENRNLGQIDCGGDNE